MSINDTVIATLLVVLCFASCTNSNTANSESTTNDTLSTSNTNTMKSYVSIFEIPATDISRAVNFYQAILDVQIETMEMPEMKMGIFPYQEQMVTGVITQAEGYNPSTEGVTIYLDGGDNLQIVLDKVEKNGGKILIPKTPHADNSGFFAIFIDSEGNRMGLHSIN